MRLTKSVPINGETFPVKSKLKALGAKWCPEAKVWLVTPAKAEEARTIVQTQSHQPREIRLRQMNGGPSAFCGGCGNRIHSPGQRCTETGMTCKPGF